MKQDSKVKKTAFQMIFGRTVVIALLLILQIVLLFMLIKTVGELAGYLTLALSFILLVFVINRGTQPAFTMAWILPLASLPVFGGLFYLFIQAQPGTRKIQKKLTLLQEETKPYLMQSQAVMENLRSEIRRWRSLRIIWAKREDIPVIRIHLYSIFQAARAIMKNSKNSCARQNVISSWSTLS